MWELFFHNWKTGLTGSSRTTTELTTSIAGSVAHALGLGEGGWVVEYIIRGVGFSCAVPLGIES
jgi:hypothetical protein